jgi:hypothetical protein
MIEHITFSAEDALDKGSFSDDIIILTNKSETEELTLTLQELEDLCLDEAIEVNPEQKVADKTFALLVEGLQSHGLLEELELD